MARHPKTAVVYDIQVRANEKTGIERYIVRWRVIGRAGTSLSRSLLDEDGATKFHDDPDDAATDRERFDMVSGLPTSMVEEDDVTIAEWSKTFIDRVAKDCVPSSRVHMGDDVVALIVRSAPAKATSLTKEQRLEIKDWLVEREEPKLSPEVARWLARWSPRLRDLERKDLLRILEQVSLKQDLLVQRRAELFEVRRRLRLPSSLRIRRGHPPSPVPRYCQMPSLPTNPFQTSRSWTSKAAAFLCNCSETFAWRHHLAVEPFVGLGLSIQPEDQSGRMIHEGITCPFA